MSIRWKPRASIICSVLCAAFLGRHSYVVAAFTKESQEQQQPQPRIVGGFASNPGSYPYMVDLDAVNGYHICMGSLIAPDYVLSAAHCGGSAAWAHIGRFDKSDPEDDHDNLEVAMEIMHPQFQSEEFKYDFMLFRLNGMSNKTLLRLNSNLTIPTAGTRLNLAGFGNIGTSEKPEYPKVLHEVMLTVMSNEMCEQSEGPHFSYGGHITEDMICANDKNGKDSCHGDSGAPLILSGDFPDDDIQIGITSWGQECGDPDFPGVYSRLSSGYKWIRSMVCEGSLAPPAHFNCESSSSEALPSVRGLGSQIEFVYELTTDAFPEENGMYLNRIDGLTVERMMTFRIMKPGTIYTERLILEKGHLYALVIIDRVGNGIFLGGVKLFLREEFGESLVEIAQIDTQLQSTNTFIWFFYATLNNSDDRYTDPLFEDGTSLTLEISFDASPQDIGLEIRDDTRGDLLYYRPPGYYFSHSQTTSSEAISLPPERHNYTITVSDVSGNGLGSSVNTGYRLRYGGYEVVASGFETGYRSSLSFTWSLEEAKLHSTTTPSDEAPVYPGAPSAFPSFGPSIAPTTRPSAVHSGQPSVSASANPSTGPSFTPTSRPSTTPTTTPSITPSARPSTVPSALPSATHSHIPSASPSRSPSLAPSDPPSAVPTTSAAPSTIPSRVLSGAPSGGAPPSPKPTTIGVPVGMPSSYNDHQITNDEESKIFGNVHLYGGGGEEGRGGLGRRRRNLRKRLKGGRPSYS